ncbi:MAG: D-alanyl-D-alanine carboxypeptidase family protein [Candidatus Peribacteria bacterium]|jgi:LAS superfamily LD-carboxypeptidase LdcB|nr:D-alanyl-D-alanine carboxypeptidase family protein [Candidatus Peribacteria bacterium]
MMIHHKQEFFLIVTLGIGLLLFPSLDYLFASQVGTLWEYNPFTANWEKVTWSETPEVLLEGNITYEEIDFFTEHSHQKFLDNDHALPPSYHPNDLVPIHSNFTFNASSNFQLREQAAEQFANMARAFAYAFDFKAKLSLTSAYRSSNYQKRLTSNCSTARCASVGTSEHEAGLAVDLGVNGGNILGNNGKYYQWLADNAHLRGFHNTYQKGVEIDGKMVEPWHWRYVDVELATHLHDSKQTLAEYFYSLYPTK